MTKLMKYELLRRKHLLIGAALSMLFAEGLALFGIFNGGEWYVLSIVMTALIVVGGLVLAFLDAVIKVYSDFKQKHGYMIFMTPQSGYRVMWAKTIFGVLEIVAAVIAIAMCLTASGIAADYVFGGVISGFIAALPLNAGFLTGTIGLGVLQGMAQLSIAILAVTVSRAMTRSNSYNWLIALVMYFALAFIVNIVDSALLAAFGVFGDIMNMTDDAAVLESGLIAKYYIIGAVTYAAWFTGCTLFSGRLVKRGIDL
jgi:ABC-2 type transport system permease protein